jgi:nucleoside-diphosphate-sugar epimerase
VSTLRVLVIGGAGYIGSSLVPRLLSAGHHVTVYDALFFGAEPLTSSNGHSRFTLVQGDIRNEALLISVMETGFDAVIFLAAVSNHPCCEIDSELTTEINKRATGTVMRLSKEFGVSRFLFASSASVYGVRDEAQVVESLALRPITLYAKYKAWGEDCLRTLASPDFCPVMLRAGTVAGYAPRLRLDLTGHILATAALTTGRINVWGGSQLRPHVHIRDLVDLYITLLTAPQELVHAQAFNVIAENHSVMEIAKLIGNIVGTVQITTEPVLDARSYHLDGTLASEVLGFHPTGTIAMAVQELADAFSDGRVLEPSDPIYRNIACMQRDPSLWRATPWT